MPSPTLPTRGGPRSLERKPLEAIAAAAGVGVTPQFSHPFRGETRTRTRQKDETRRHGRRGGAPMDARVRTKSLSMGASRTSFSPRGGGADPPPVATAKSFPHQQWLPGCRLTTGAASESASVTAMMNWPRPSARWARHSAGRPGIRAWKRLACYLLSHTASPILRGGCAANVRIQAIARLCRHDSSHWTVSSNVGRPWPIGPGWDRRRIHSG
jgi:hypothetical protein